MRRLFFILSIIVLVVSACGSADGADRIATDNQQEIYRTKQPIPLYDYSFERDMVVQIYNARNDALNTWSVWRSDTGIVEDWCPSIGFGIPYDTSLTNPLKYTGQGGSIEQAEPNGLFSSKNTSATWVLCQLPNGEISPVYIESKVTVYAWPIKVENNQVVHLYEQSPSVVIKTKTGS